MQIDECPTVDSIPLDAPDEKMETSCSSTPSRKSPGKTGNVRSSPREKRGSDPGKRSSTSPGSKLKGSSGPSPKKISLLKPSPKRKRSPSPVPLTLSPDRRRHSWRRSGMKGTNHRKSLPSIHHDISDLSKSISLELPETERLSQLLKSCFQFSVKKLEDSLSHVDGFDAEAFKAKVLAVTQDVNHFTDRLERDGTLLKCTEEPNCAPPDPALEEEKSQINDYIARFTKECHSWDQILLDYQKTAMERGRLLEEIKCKKVEVPIAPAQRTSQDKVIHSKPNYERILRDQSEVFDYMETVVDRIQQAVAVVHSFIEENSENLKVISAQLELHSFQKMQNSPLRRFLKVPQKGRL